MGGGRAPIYADKNPPASASTPALPGTCPGGQHRGKCAAGASVRVQFSIADNVFYTLSMTVAVAMP